MAGAAPKVDVFRSEDGGRWVVQIDTEVETGVVTVYVNDGLVAEGDPELTDMTCDNDAGSVAPI